MVILSSDVVMSYTMLFYSVGLQVEIEVLVLVLFCNILNLFLKNIQLVCKSIICERFVYGAHICDNR